ncbi:efflux RND transporter permease subunit [Aetokthonos hydrillicola Thurmond2011]|uniref:Efflux RND transporter permease subunit n=4 Tax=Aetokthonos TaxID=1550243 RepID=A0AAP5MAY6_9CYAN|nr:efflux RND transporter permease subunit [Aetokthonos hydrillicola]MBW4584470.1 efflux RND transporter permease subunit [Aetokthonos hydrillicola CCALA 1050]MDR9896433.1 efflux RND transporter permease subunit [Aetokthonos hydrillicola Thurmond2011]
MILSIADIFIKRPVLTTVCTILIVLLGGICLPLLPIEYIPQIAPIQVQISSSYVGADPQTIETTVTTPIERKLNGTRDMQYFSSTSATGTSNISAYFGVGTNPSVDQVNIQNNLQQATPLLPSAVQQQGIVVKTASTSLLVVYGFFSPNDEYDAKFISNYVDLYVNDEIARIQGVGQVNIFGQQQYAMRVWLDPNALASRGLTVTDVTTAVQAQNLVVGGGSVGGEPAPKGQQYQIPLKLQGMFKNATEAENIVVKVASDGTQIKLRDVGRVELGAQSYTSAAKINGKPGVALSVYQLPGSNALDVANRIDTRMKELEQSFPPGIKRVLVYDTVGFIEESNKEVLYTLLEAIALVVLVIFVFLQNWRATVIPTIAIPVSLLGAMVFAKVLGFSINSLTMFGLVLATGLVVDDAILVVEAISTKMDNEGKSAREASFEAMNELSGALIATGLVLMAVFVPVSFFPGATGLLYKQFALIIAFSVAVSVFNAISFSPSVSAILLRPTRPATGPLGWFFRKFNQGFSWVVRRYISLVQFLIRLRYGVIAVFVVGLIATVFMFRVVPTGFVPSEDQGSILGIVQGPNSASRQYTENILDQVHETLTGIPEIVSVAEISGAGFNGNVANQGIFFSHLKPWDERKKSTQTVSAILKRLNVDLGNKITGAIVVASSPPPISGFSPLGGANMQLEDTTQGRYSFQDFAANAQAILQKANQTGVFAPPRGAYTQFTADTPQYEIDINRDRLNALNVNFNDVLNTISTSFGSSYVTQFVLGPRYYQVYVELDAQYRNNPEALKQLYVRSSSSGGNSSTTTRSTSTTNSNNTSNNIVSLDQLITIKPYTGPAVISHFNGYRSILLQGAQSSNYSSGQALDAIQKAYQQSALPGIKFEWSDLSREQVASGSLGSLIFLFSIVIVFLVLAAQYESYIDPTIILLTVPLAILGALGAVALRRFVEPTLANDVYCNIALVMLIGLASKNAILIVEFANLAMEEGKSIVDAALTASEERFRPILMTAIAALVGFFPLVIASGAGANARHSLGTAVFGGLLVATILSLVILPVLYVVIKTLEVRFLGGDKSKRGDGSTPPPSSSSEQEYAHSGSGKSTKPEASRKH